MTFAPLNRQERKEWREMLAPVDGARLFAVLLMFVFSCLATVFCNSTAVAVIYLVYAVVFYYTLTHSVLSVAILAAPGILLFGISVGLGGMSQGFLLPALYAALLLGSVSGAFLLLQLSRKPIRCLLLLLPVAAVYLIAWWITSSPRMAMLALIPAGIAAVLGLCMLWCFPHTRSVILVALSIGVIGAGAYLLTMLFVGFPEGNVLVHLTQTVRDGVTRYYSTMYEMALSQNMSLGLSATDISNQAALIGNLLPGLVGVACLVLAYAAWRMLLRLIAEWRVLPRIPARLGLLSVSPYAAGIFTVAFVASMIANAQTVTVFGMLAENLSLILQPAMVLVGFASLTARDREPSCLGSLLPLLLIGLLFISPNIALTLTAFLGAFHILWAHLAPRDKGGT